MSEPGDHGDHERPTPPPVPPGGWAPTAATPGPPPPPPAPPSSGTPQSPGYPPGPSGYPPTPPGYPPSPPGYGQPQAYGYTPYGTGPRTDGMAIAALCCGIAAIPFFCGFGLVLGILGVVFGLVSMRKIDRSAGSLTGRGMALAGAICGGVGIAFNLVWVVIAVVGTIADSGTS